MYFKIASKLVFVLLLFTTTELPMATMSLEHTSFQWIEKQYRMELPAPFRDFRVHITQNDDGHIQSLAFVVNGENYTVQSSLISDLDYLTGEPDVSIEDSAISDAGLVKSVSVGFSYGAMQKVILNDVPGCEEPCVDWVRNIVMYQIDDHKRISRTLTDVAKILTDANARHNARRNVAD